MCQWFCIFTQIVDKMYLWKSQKRHLTWNPYTLRMFLFRHQQPHGQHLVTYVLTAKKERHHICQQQKYKIIRCFFVCLFFCLSLNLYMYTCSPETVFEKEAFTSISLLTPLLPDAGSKHRFVWVFRVLCGSGMSGITYSI